MLAGVSCPSMTDCTAVGTSFINQPRPGKRISSTSTLAERWNGVRWSIEQTPNEQLVETYDGRRVASGAALDGVSCPSVHACTATGGSVMGPTLAARWNGTRWALQQTPRAPVDTYFSGVACTSNSACTAIGAYFNTAGAGTVAERWSDDHWSVQPTPNPGLPPCSAGSGCPPLRRRGSK
jgi:hypothetical protein